jgi:hypothetical protein
MKVALCLHGNFDSQFDSTSNGMDGYEHIKKHILDKHDVEVFIHSWEVDKEDLIRDLYKPTIAKFEKQIDFTDIVYDRKLNELKGVPRPPQNVLSHFYSMSKAMSLPYGDRKLWDIQKYDCVIKARFDLGRINRDISGPGKPNPYPVQCINLLDKIEENKIYNADWQHFNMGPADMWFYGSHYIMSEFQYLYQDFVEEFHIGSDFHKWATLIEGNPGDLSGAVAYYKWWMIKKGMWNNRINLETHWE